MATVAARGRFLTFAAIGFALLAVSDLLKPLELSPEEGLVFFGERLTGQRNMLIAPLFAAYLFTYAWGIWNLRRFALTLGRWYATYVVVNLCLFQLRTPPPPGAGIGWYTFGVVYAAVAIGVSVYAWYELALRREQLT
jgi:hypothetical protein